MEFWFPAMSNLPLLETPLPQPVFETASEEEWTLQTHCICSGLPPFPVSTFGYGYHYHHSVHTEFGFGFQEQNLLFTDGAVPLQRMTLPVLDLIKSNVPLPIRKRSRSFSVPEVKPRVLPKWNCGDESGQSTGAASKAARMRRKRISERMARLASLMPWERKMNTGNMLEEAWKYVKFLEAQVIALQYMPLESYFNPPPSSAVGDDGSWRSVLDTLNRQQLLEVLVNSRTMQERLYEEGLCLYSEEQMILASKIVERKKMLIQHQHQYQHQETQLQMMVQGSGSSSVSS